LDEEAVRFGRDRYGLELQVGTVHDMTINRNPDVVIYAHTLEHILNPFEELEKVRSMMAANAIFYIEVPGIKAIPLRYQSDLLMCLQVAHVYYFTLTTLQNLLGKAGFEFIHGDEYVHSVFRVAAEPRQNDRMESDYEIVMESLRQLEDAWKELVVSQKL
jgi:hypothetical protein